MQQWRRTSRSSVGGIESDTLEFAPLLRYLSISVRHSHAASHWLELCCCCCPGSKYLELNWSALWTELELCRVELNWIRIGKIASVSWHRRRQGISLPVLFCLESGFELCKWNWSLLNWIWTWTWPNCWIELKWTNRRTVYDSRRILLYLDDVIRETNDVRTIEPFATSVGDQCDTLESCGWITETAVHIAKFGYRQLNWLIFGSITEEIP